MVSLSAAMARLGDAQQLLALLDDKRPLFWAWLRLNELDYRAVAASLEADHAYPVSHAHLWAICLPWADRRRVEPSEELKGAIAAFTRNMVRPEHWDAPAANDGEAVG